MTIQIILPWPNAHLSPNGRLNWHAKASAVKAARWESRVLALEQAARARLPKDAPLEVSLLFCRPTMRKNDLDNMIARSKAAIDGVADALEINDHQIKKISGAWGETQPGGRVELRLDVLPR